MILSSALLVFTDKAQRSSIRITLENVSLLPIDFVHLTFEDSTIIPAQQALTEGDLPVFDTYETEYDLIHRPVFTWDSRRNAHDIHPGEKTVIIVDCYGKVGWYVTRLLHSARCSRTLFTVPTGQCMYPTRTSIAPRLLWKRLQMFFMLDNSRTRSWLLYTTC